MPLVLRGRIAWARDWVSNPALGAVFETLPRGAGFTVNGARSAANELRTDHRRRGAAHQTANMDEAIGKFDSEFSLSARRPMCLGTGALKYSW